MTSRTSQRISLERRTYRETPSGRYHYGFVDAEGNVYTLLSCPARVLTDVNDTSGSVPDAMICVVCFRRD